jgi:hypothetical protein
MVAVVKVNVETAQEYQDALEKAFDMPAAADVAGAVSYYNVLSNRFRHASMWAVSSGTTAEKAAQMLIALEYCRDNNLVLDMTGVETFLAPDSFTLADNQNISIYASSAVRPKIKATGNGTALITAVDKTNIKLIGIELNSNGFDCGGVLATALTDGKPVTCHIERSKIDVSSGNENGVRLLGHKDRVDVLYNDFVGNENPSLTGWFYQLQTLLTIPDHDSPLKDDTPITIRGNRFVGGAMQYSTFGTDSPASPLIIDGNTFINAAVRAMHIYHGEDAFVTNNTIIGCKGLRPTQALETIGGAVFLDLYSPLVDQSRDGCVFSNNIIKRCFGVGIIMEEVTGTLSGWTITDTGFFPNNYTYVGNEGFETRGGHAFVLTGGNRRVQINIRADGNHGPAIVVDHTLGVSTKPPITVLEFNSNVDENFQEGYLIRNSVKVVKFTGGTCIGNGRAAANTHDAIRIERDGSSNTVAKCFMDGVVFDDEVVPVNHRHCLGKSYPGMYLNAKNNVLNSLSQWINTGGTVTGIISNNFCEGARGFTTAGDPILLDNEGWKTEEAVNITTSAALTEYTHTMAASLSKATATPRNQSVPINVVCNVLSSKLQIRCFDADNVPITSGVSLTLRLSSGTSKA